MNIKETLTLISSLIGILGISFSGIIQAYYGSEIAYLTVYLGFATLFVAALVFTEVSHE